MGLGRRQGCRGLLRSCSDSASQCPDCSYSLPVHTALFLGPEPLSQKFCHKGRSSVRWLISPSQGREPSREAAASRQEAGRRVALCGPGTLQASPGIGSLSQEASDATAPRPSREARATHGEDYRRTRSLRQRASA